VESEPIASIPFDCKLFGTAANNGQMIAELSALSRTPKLFLALAKRLTGHAIEPPQRSSLLAPIARLFGAK
jgi:pilus assembly protein CpaE